MEVTHTTALFAGSFFGALTIVIGAFGAHALKKHMTKEVLESFETGVRYQMYHALLLLIIGFMPFNSYSYYAGNIIIIGVILFSFSIYGLALSTTFGKKIKILGPITPIGGLALVIGWILLFISFLSL
ncbi:DUF423 domain-containing protein [Myroides odoratus]|uniref:DUF423 domain-containing protein n=1 Tax=Myroides odoratus TaxID=256 RepID=UPI0039AF6C49